VTWRDRQGADHAAEVVRLPFFDAEKRIPRGLEPTDPVARAAVGSCARPQSPASGNAVAR